jgi:hypothetical protein
MAEEGQMGDEPRGIDQMTRSELEQEVSAVGWNIGKIAETSVGMILTFRKHYTSDFLGVETKVVDGENASEAIRKFLRELGKDES